MYAKTNGHQQQLPQKHTNECSLLTREEIVKGRIYVSQIDNWDTSVHRTKFMFASEQTVKGNWRMFELEQIKEIVVDSPEHVEWHLKAKETEIKRGYRYLVCRGKHKKGLFFRYRALSGWIDHYQIIEEYDPNKIYKHEWHST